MNEPLTTGLPCEVHGSHLPHPHVNHIHHVWPLGRGGPDVPANTVVVCPTGHYNIHDLLDQYLVHRGEVPYSVRVRYARSERALALLGYQRITQGHL